MSHGALGLVAKHDSVVLSLQPKVMPNAICGICQKGKESNKKGKPEALIHCSQCKNSGKWNFCFVFKLKLTNHNIALFIMNIKLLKYEQNNLVQLA